MSTNGQSVESMAGAAEDDASALADANEVYPSELVSLGMEEDPVTHAKFIHAKWRVYNELDARSLLVALSSLPEEEIRAHWANAPSACEALPSGPEVAVEVRPATVAELTAKLAKIAPPAEVARVTTAAQGKRSKAATSASPSMEAPPPADDAPDRTGMLLDNPITIDVVKATDPKVIMRWVRELGYDGLEQVTELCSSVFRDECDLLLATPIEAIPALVADALASVMAEEEAASESDLPVDETTLQRLRGHDSFSEVVQTLQAVGFRSKEQLMPVLEKLREHVPVILRVKGLEARLEMTLQVIRDKAGAQVAKA